MNVSALITKADYEHYICIEHIEHYMNEVIPNSCCLIWRATSRFVPNNNNQINIKKYITYYKQSNEK
nr:hypothetical protein [Mycoplasmopsis bovis]